MARHTSKILQQTLKDLNKKRPTILRHYVLKWLYIFSIQCLHRLNLVNISNSFDKTSLLRVHLLASLNNLEMDVITFDCENYSCMVYKYVSLFQRILSK